MGVKKLTSYMEQHTGGRGFKRVSIKDLKEEYEKKYPGKPVEVLLDVECCLRFIYDMDKNDFRYGGDNITLILLLKNFFNKFNSLGIKIISFYGNYTFDEKRHEWMRRRYKTVKCVNELFDYMKKNPSSYPNQFSLIPPGLCITSCSIIKYILKERVVQSLTENDIEIIFYAKKYSSFAIISQDSDFIIANAAEYYLSIKYLDLDTMTTCMYDTEELCKIHNLHENQLALYATIIGTDMIPYDLLHTYHKKFIRKNPSSRELNYEYFFHNLSKEIQNIPCDSSGMPSSERNLIYLIRNIRGYSSNYSFDEIYNMIIHSIQSFSKYEMEKELYIDQDNENSNQILGIAICLYRQCMINSDLLMLICSKKIEMSTCMERFSARNKPIGERLAKLRQVLYGATFYGDSSIKIDEYVVTGIDFFNNDIPQVSPLPLTDIKNLLSVWNLHLELDTNTNSSSGDNQEIYTEWFDSKATINNNIYKINNNNLNLSVKYFINIFRQSCNLNSKQIEILNNKFTELIPSVLIPLFSFLYLEQYSQEIYANVTYRNCLLFSFLTLSCLPSLEVHNLSLTASIDQESNSHLIEISNLFRRCNHIIININSVCGFPINVKFLDGHNYWEGKYFYKFYQILKENSNRMYQISFEYIKRSKCEKIENNFQILIEFIIQMKLVDKNSCINT